MENFWKKQFLPSLIATAFVSFLGYIGLIILSFINDALNTQIMLLAVFGIILFSATLCLRKKYNTLTQDRLRCAATELIKKHRGCVSKINKLRVELRKSERRHLKSISKIDTTNASTQKLKSNIRLTRGVFLNKMFEQLIEQTTFLLDGLKDVAFILTEHHGIQKEDIITSFLLTDGKNPSILDNGVFKIIYDSNTKPESVLDVSPPALVRNSTALSTAASANIFKVNNTSDNPNHNKLLKIEKDQSAQIVIPELYIKNDSKHLNGFLSLLIANEKDTELIDIDNSDFDPITQACTLSLCHIASIIDLIYSFHGDYVPFLEQLKIDEIKKRDNGSS